MTVIKINVNMLNENIKILEKKYELFMNKNDDIYMRLRNISNEWVDVQQENFSEVINSNYSKIVDFDENFSKYLKMLKEFCSNVVSIYKTFGIGNLKSIFVNTGIINFLFEILNSSLNILNDVYNVLDSSNIPTSFKYHNQCMILKFEINKIKMELFDYKDEMDRVLKLIDNLISKSRKSIDNFDKTNLELSDFNYFYSINSINEKSVKIYDSEKI